MKRILILSIIIIVTLSCSVIYYKEGVLPANASDNSTKIFVIKKGEGLDNIINNLSDQKLIRSKVIFFILLKKLGLDKKIQAGDFRLSPSMDANQIAKLLTHGTLDVWLTIIEGTRKEEVAQVVSQNLDIPEIEFLKYAKEGYLFPDTYLVPKNATAVAVIKLMEDNFNKKYNQTLRNIAKSKNLTTDQVVTLASMIEREAKFSEDRQQVANVLMRRLKDQLPLQIDSTVQYALGYQPEEKTWWKTVLTQADLAIKSDYNTYLNIGLPPGPISNPGLASLESTVYADANTPYIFYVSDSVGHLHFAKTLEEHNENIRKFIK